ncbi:hypothetical protein PQX77_022268 [Marasmius sp. AFHP31]|nr:hypothetical protein PQX77_022268 [Marasmius sp. AFHP31]
MSNYKSFSIVGVGDIGSHIVKALLSKGVTPVIITRKSSNTDFSKKFPGASLKIARVSSYDNIEELAAAFEEHEVEVVLSTLGSDVIKVEPALAEAAKKAGVKLFVPSEYGFVTEGASKVPGAPTPEESLLVWKDQFADSLKELGLTYARFFVGSFFGYVPWITGYESNDKVNIVGKGERPISFTDEADIGGFVAHVLTTLPPSELVDRCFRIEGDHTTILELGKRLNKEVAFVDKIPGEPLNDLKNTLVLIFDKGEGSTAWDHAKQGLREHGTGNHNHLWSGHKWKTFADLGMGL